MKMDGIDVLLHLYILNFFFHFISSLAETTEQRRQASLAINVFFFSNITG